MLFSLKFKSKDIVSIALLESKLSISKELAIGMFNCLNQHKIIGVNKENTHHFVL
jgi:hypothetical protein